MIMINEEWGKKLLYWLMFLNCERMHMSLYELPRFVNYMIWQMRWLMWSCVLEYVMIDLW